MVAGAVERAVADLGGTVAPEHVDQRLIEALNARVQGYVAMTLTPLEREIEAEKLRLGVYAYLACGPLTAEQRAARERQREAAVSHGAELLAALFPYVESSVREKAVEGFRLGVLELEELDLAPSFRYPVSDVNFDLSLDAWEHRARSYTDIDYRRTFKVYQAHSDRAPAWEREAVARRTDDMLREVLLHYVDLRQYLAPDVPLDALTERYETYGRRMRDLAAEREQERVDARDPSASLKRRWLLELHEYDVLTALYEAIDPAPLLFGEHVDGGTYCLAGQPPMRFSLSIAQSAAKARRAIVEESLDGVIVPAGTGRRLEVIARRSTWRSRASYYETIGIAFERYENHFKAHFLGIGYHPVYSTREPWTNDHVRLKSAFHAPRDYQVYAEARQRHLVKSTSRILPPTSTDNVVTVAWPGAAWMYFDQIERGVYRIEDGRKTAQFFEVGTGALCASAVWRQPEQGSDGRWTQEVVMNVLGPAFADPSWPTDEGAGHAAEPRVLLWRFELKGTDSGAPCQTLEYFSIATQSGEPILELRVEPMDPGQAPRVVSDDIRLPLAFDPKSATVRDRYYEVYKDYFYASATAHPAPLAKPDEFLRRLDALDALAGAEGDYDAQIAITRLTLDVLDPKADRERWRATATKLLALAAEHADDEQLARCSSNVLAIAKSLGDIDTIKQTFETLLIGHRNNVDAFSLLNRAGGLMVGNEAVGSAAALEAVCEKVVVGDPLEREARKKLVDAYDLWHRQQCEGASPHAELCAFIAEKRNNAASAWAAGSIASPSSGG